MVIVINSVIDGFSWVDLVWLVASTVHLKAREPVRLMLFMDWEDQFPHELSLTDIPALGSYKGRFPESRSSIPESRS